MHSVSRQLGDISLGAKQFVRLGLQTRDGRFDHIVADLIEQLIDPAGDDAADIRQSDSQRAEHAGIGVIEDPRDPKFTRDATEMLTGGAAEPDQRQAADITPLRGAYRPHRFGHVRHRDVQETFGKWFA